MSDPAPTTTTAAHAEVHEDSHGPYLYRDSGIAEGHARVPKWLAAVIFALLAFWGWYIATQWDAQTTSAQMKK